MNFSQFKKKTLRTVEEFNDSQGFWERNRSRYLNSAKVIAHQTLQALRPVDQDPQEWSIYTSDFVNLIATEYLGEPNGLRIERSSVLAFRNRQGERRGTDPTADLFKDEEILEWVEEVKNFTPEDANQGTLHQTRSTEAVAAIISHILNDSQLQFEGIGSDYSGLRKSLEDFVNGKDNIGPLGSHLGKVAEAWGNYFHSVTPKEFLKFAAKDLSRKLQ